MEHQATAAPLLFQFLLLVIFLIAGKVINKFKVYKVNGAKGYLIAAAIIFTINLLLAFNSENVPSIDRPYVIGQLLGAFLFPVLLALVISVRFSKKNKSTLSLSES